MNKIITTLYITKRQHKLLLEESEKTGNSQSSIIRMALENHWKDNGMYCKP